MNYDRKQKDLGQEVSGLTGQMLQSWHSWGGGRTEKEGGRLAHSVHTKGRPSEFSILDF